MTTFVSKRHIPWFQRRMYLYQAEKSVSPGLFVSCSRSFGWWWTRWWEGWGGWSGCCWCRPQQTYCQGSTQVQSSGLPPLGRPAKQIIHITWLIDLTSQIAGDHVEGDEFVAAGDDVAIVRGELHCKDGKLVSLKAVLQRPSGSVHAVVAGDQSILLDAFSVALAEKVPDVVAVLNLWKQTPHQLSRQHPGVKLKEMSTIIRRARVTLSIAPPRRRLSATRPISWMQRTSFESEKARKMLLPIVPCISCWDPWPKPAETLTMKNQKPKVKQWSYLIPSLTNCLLSDFKNVASPRNFCLLHLFDDLTTFPPTTSFS